MTDRGRGRHGRLAAAVLLAGLSTACSTGNRPQMPAARTTVIDSRHGRMALVVDVDDTEPEPATVDRLLTDASTDVGMITRPEGVVWRRVRDRAPARLRVAIIESCAHGRSEDCASEAARFIEGWRDGTLGPATGSVIEDTIRGSAAAPPAVVIPTGQFSTGVGTGSEAWVQRFAGRSVRLMRPVAIARTETTVAQFRRFVDATGYRAGRGCQNHTRDQIWETHDLASWESPVIPQTGDHPVTCVTFEDARAYAAWLTEATGHTWRLPTEPEAGFFVRSGHAGRFGVDVTAVTDLCAKANGADQASGLAYANPCNDGFAATAPVGSFPPNAFGLFDATGNVWEMTSTCMESDYWRAVRDRVGLASSDASAAGNSDCPGRHVVRGGAFLSSPGNLEADHREIEAYRSNRTGFRLVRELSAP